MATKPELKEAFSTGEVPTGSDFSDLIEHQGTPGKKGEPGKNGKDSTVPGPKGEPGTNGTDGFGTEAEYNDLVSRLEALEGVE